MRPSLSALRLVPSPTSSLEGICASGASEISVGERCGPGLIGGFRVVLIFLLPERPWPAWV